MAKRYISLALRETNSFQIILVKNDRNKEDKFENCNKIFVGEKF